MLNFKPVIPKEIAVLTDMLGHFIFLLHRQLDSQPQHHDELIKNYRAREVCLYDIPLGFYANEDGEQNASKGGGDFAILGSNIQQVCKDHKVKLNVEHLIRDLKNRFPDRELKIL